MQSRAVNGVHHITERQQSGQSRLLRLLLLQAKHEPNSGLLVLTDVLLCPSGHQQQVAHSHIQSGLNWHQ